MISEIQTQLVVLAGGKGSRLGVDKSRIQLDGTPILHHLLNRLQWRGPTLLVTSGATDRLEGASGFTATIADQFPGEGPLGGIVTALSATLATFNADAKLPEKAASTIAEESIDRIPDATSIVRQLVILPIDLVRISRPEVLALLDAPPNLSIACFDRFDNNGNCVLEPLPMRIDVARAESIRAHFLAGGRSLRSLLNLENAGTVSAPPEWTAEVWLNVNNAADLHAASGSIART